ncbi:uncharacterized protein LOC144292850 isoform X2 [Canis aureus]
MCPRKVLTRRHSWMCLDCSTMQEDSETLLALQRPNIMAQYHQGQGAARPQPPRGQETPPGDPARGQIDKNAQAMGPLPPQREAAAPGLQGGPAPGAGTGVAAIAERRPGNEGGSPGLLPGHHADRPGRQPDVPQSHHVLGPLRGWRALFHVLAAYSVYDTVSVPAPASCPAGGLVLSAGDQRDSQSGAQLHGPQMPGRVSLLRDGQGAGCRPPRGGRACVPEGRGCQGPPSAPRPS